MLWRVYDGSGALTEEALERFSADSWPLRPDRPSLRVLIVGLSGENGAGQEELVCALTFRDQPVSPPPQPKTPAKRAKASSHPKEDKSGLNQKPQQTPKASAKATEPGIYASELVKWEGGTLLAMFVEKAGLVYGMGERLERILLKISDVFVPIFNSPFSATHLQGFHQFLYDAHFVNHLTSLEPKQRQDSVRPFPADPRLQIINSTFKKLVVVDLRASATGLYPHPSLLAHAKDTRELKDVFFEMMKSEGEEDWEKVGPLTRMMSDVGEVFKSSVLLSKKVKEDAQESRWELAALVAGLKALAKPSRLKVRVLQVLCDASLPKALPYPAIPGLNTGSMYIIVKCQDGKILTLLADPSDTVELTKMKVRAESGLPVEHQRLFFDWPSELANWRTLGDYGIQNEDSLDCYLVRVGCVCGCVMDERGGGRDDAQPRDCHSPEL